MRPEMEGQLRLMTANLLVDRVDPVFLRDVLDMVQPDVVVLQELGHKTADLVERRFPYHHLRPELRSKGGGIASRLPGRFGDIPMPWRAGLWARLEHGTDGLLVANLHLRNPISFPWWSSYGLRRGQLEAILAWGDVQTDERLVLAGDMNSSPAWPLYRRMARRWEDLVARSAVDRGLSARPTWAWRPGWPRMLRIDHVFGAGVHPVGSEVIPLEGSDHAAVVIDLALD